MRSTVTYTPPAWSLHGSRQIKRAWDVLDEAYQLNPWDAQLSGARAAAEWSLGLAAVSPITNERKDPDYTVCQWEGYRAAMRERDIGVTEIPGQTPEFRRQYAHGVRCWMFWWTGQEPLPFWLVRVTPPNPEAS